MLQENARAVYALPYELLAEGGGKSGVKGLMLLNKRNYTLHVVVPGVVGGNATVVEATGAALGWEKRAGRGFAGDGSIRLGPYAVAVAPELELARGQ